ncbi:hypothetical protein ACKVMT_09990 [Halobacteriales archaeon Cl-PHB]
MTETHITAYSDLSERFQEVKADLEDEYGCSLDNTDVLRELIRESSH